MKRGVSFNAFLRYDFNKFVSKIQDSYNLIAMQEKEDHHEISSMHRYT